MTVSVSMFMSVSMSVVLFDSVVLFVSAAISDVSYCFLLLCKEKDKKIRGQQRGVTSVCGFDCSAAASLKPLSGQQLLRIQSNQINCQT